jgi:hypothetical protein
MQGFMTTLIEQLRENLIGRAIEVRDHPEGITVPAASEHGFDVSLLFQEGRYLVGFHRWGLDAFDPSEAGIAERLFAACLSDRTRLMVVARGGKDVSWRLEKLNGEAWVTLAHVSNLLKPFWLPKRIRCLQNHMNLPVSGDPS